MLPRRCRRTKSGAAVTVSTRTVRGYRRAEHVATPTAQFHSAAATGISSKIDDPARYQLANAAVSRPGARSARTSRADTLFAGAFLTSAFAEAE